MAVINLTRIFEQPWESLFKLLCKLPQEPQPGTRVVLDRRTLDLLVNKMDEVSEALVASPNDAQGNMAYDRTQVVYLERLLFLCRLMAHDEITFEDCNPWTLLLIKCLLRSFTRLVEIERKRQINLCLRGRIVDKIFVIMDAVSRLNGSDYQFLVVRSTFWPFVKVVFDDGLSCETRKNCVASLNEHVNECNLSVLKAVIAPGGKPPNIAFWELFKKIASRVTSCGDYVFQVGLVELLCRLLPASEFNRRDFSGKMWPRKEAAEAYLAIDYNEFEYGVRGFLNAINAINATSSTASLSVLTFACDGVALGEHELSAPRREGGSTVPFWIDFNRGSSSVSFNHQLPSKEEWELLIVGALQLSGWHVNLQGEDDEVAVSVRLSLRSNVVHDENVSGNVVCIRFRRSRSTASALGDRLREALLTIFGEGGEGSLEVDEPLPFVSSTPSTASKASATEKAADKSTGSTLASSSDPAAAACSVAPTTSAGNFRTPPNSRSLLGSHATDWTNTRKQHRAIQILAAGGEISLDEDGGDDSKLSNRDGSFNTRVSDSNAVAIVSPSVYSPGAVRSTTILAESTAGAAANATRNAAVPSIKAARAASSAAAVLRPHRGSEDRASRRQSKKSSQDEEGEGSKSKDKKSSRRASSVTLPVSRHSSVSSERDVQNRGDPSPGRSKRPAANVSVASSHTSASTSVATSSSSFLVANEKISSSKRQIQRARSCGERESAQNGDENPQILRQSSASAASAPPHLLPPGRERCSQSMEAMAVVVQSRSWVSLDGSVDSMPVVQSRSSVSIDGSVNSLPDGRHQGNGADFVPETQVEETNVEVARLELQVSATIPESQFLEEVHPAPVGNRSQGTPLSIEDRAFSHDSSSIEANLSIAAPAAPSAVETSAQEAASNGASGSSQDEIEASPPLPPPLQSSTKSSKRKERKKADLANRMALVKGSLQSTADSSVRSDVADRSNDLVENGVDETSVVSIPEPPADDANASTNQKESNSASSVEKRSSAQFIQTIVTTPVNEESEEGDEKEKEEEEEEEEDDREDKDKIKGKEKSESTDDARGGSTDDTTDIEEELRRLRSENDRMSADIRELRHDQSADDGRTTDGDDDVFLSSDHADGEGAGDERGEGESAGTKTVAAREGAIGRRGFLDGANEEDTVQYPSSGSCSLSEEIGSDRKKAIDEKVAECIQQIRVDPLRNELSQNTSDGIQDREENESGGGIEKNGDMEDTVQYLSSGSCSPSEEIGSDQKKAIDEKVAECFQQIRVNPPRNELSQNTSDGIQDREENESGGGIEKNGDVDEERVEGDSLKESEEEEGMKKNEAGREDGIDEYRRRESQSKAQGNLQQMEVDGELENERRKDSAESNCRIKRIGNVNEDYVNGDSPKAIEEEKIRKNKVSQEEKIDEENRESRSRSRSKARSKLQQIEVDGELGNERKKDGAESNSGLEKNSNVNEEYVEGDSPKAIEEGKGIKKNKANKEKRVEEYRQRKSRSRSRSKALSNLQQMEVDGELGNEGRENGADKEKEAEMAAGESGTGDIQEGKGASDPPSVPKGVASRRPSRMKKTPKRGKGKAERSKGSKDGDDEGAKTKLSESEQDVSRPRSEPTSEVCSNESAKRDSERESKRVADLPDPELISEEISNASLGKESEQKDEGERSSEREGIQSIPNVATEKGPTSKVCEVLATEGPNLHEPLFARCSEEETGRDESDTLEPDSKKNDSDRAKPNQEDCVEGMGERKVAVATAALKPIYAAAEPGLDAVTSTADNPAVHLSADDEDVVDHSQPDHAAAPAAAIPVLSATTTHPIPDASGRNNVTTDVLAKYRQAIANTVDDPPKISAGRKRRSKKDAESPSAAELDSASAATQNPRKSKRRKSRSSETMESEDRDKDSDGAAKIPPASCSTVASPPATVATTSVSTSAPTTAAAVSPATPSLNDTAATGLATPKPTKSKKLFSADADYMSQCSQSSQNTPKGLPEELIFAKENENKGDKNGKGNSRGDDGGGDGAGQTSAGKSANKSKANAKSKAIANGEKSFVLPKGVVVPPRDTALNSFSYRNDVDGAACSSRVPADGDGRENGSSRSESLFSSQFRKTNPKKFFRLTSLKERNAQYSNAERTALKQKPINSDPRVFDHFDKDFEKSSKKKNIGGKGMKEAKERRSIDEEYVPSEKKRKKSSQAGKSKSTKASRSGVATTTEPEVEESILARMDMEEAMDVNFPPSTSSSRKSTDKAPKEKTAAKATGKVPKEKTAKAAGRNVNSESDGDRDDESDEERDGERDGERDDERRKEASESVADAADAAPTTPPGRRRSGRVKGKKINYAEVDEKSVELQFAKVEMDFSAEEDHQIRSVVGKGKRGAEAARKSVSFVGDDDGGKEGGVGSRRDDEDDHDGDVNDGDEDSRNQRPRLPHSRLLSAARSNSSIDSVGSMLNDDSGFHGDDSRTSRVSVTFQGDGVDEGNDTDGASDINTDGASDVNDGRPDERAAESAERLGDEEGVSRPAGERALQMILTRLSSLEKKMDVLIGFQRKRDD